LPANSQKPQAAPSLDGYFVIVGLTGGIAAYKIAQTVSSLVKLGGQLQVVTTRSGKKFVGPATFQALTGREVLSSLWHRRSVHALHVELAGGADLILVAPATANIIGKVANGIADDLLSCLIMAADCPVVFAPAMNVHRPGRGTAGLWRPRHRQAGRARTDCPTGLWHTDRQTAQEPADRSTLAPLPRPPCWPVPDPRGMNCNSGARKIAYSCYCRTHPPIYRPCSIHQ